MKETIQFFKWAGIFIIAAVLLVPIQNQDVRAAGESPVFSQSSLSASPQDALLTQDDLPGFRQARESEVVGYLAFAQRITSGLFGPQTAISNFSTFRTTNIFQSEFIISFLAHPISEEDASEFDALANDPQSILQALTNSARTSGNTEVARLLPDLGDVGEKSMGFSMTLGQEPIAQNIDFIWARRGNILQSLWAIYPIGGAPSRNLHQMGLVVDQRVTERFPGTTFRPAGLLVPEITTHIPTPLDISTRPSVIGTNLLLAALMMLPFTLAAEVFTRLSAEREELLRNIFRPVSWLLNLPRRFERFLSAHWNKQGTGANILQLSLIIFFYGLTFSLLDRTWNPLSVTGLVLFLNMTVAYGIVGIADDIVQWRVLKKWGEPAEINLRPTNIWIAAASTLTSRLLTIVPGLMFGTPEALIIDESRLQISRRNYLLKITAYTLLGIGFGLWSLTAITDLVQRQDTSDTIRNGIGGLEGFLLIAFAVALENTFVQMLGIPGSFGELLRKKSRWLWSLGLVGITFAFYHTLINPRGELSAALRESNVQIFLGAAGAFVLFTFGLWIYLTIRGIRRTGIQQAGEKSPGKVGLGKIIPAWVWLAATVIGLTVIGDIVISSHNQEVGPVSSAPSPAVVASTPAASPSPVAPVRNTTELPFAAPVAIKKLCYVPAVNITQNVEDSFTWRSVQLAAAQYGAQAEYLDPTTPDEAGYKQVINQLVQDSCDLTIGNWASQGRVFQAAAGGNPGLDFVLVGQGTNPPSGGAWDLPNLWTTEYSLPEGAYLAGYLAAASSKSGVIGTLGATQTPTVVSSLNCFAQGVNDYSQAHQRKVGVLGWEVGGQQGLFAGGFTVPDKGASLTNDLVAQGADIIFPMAGVGAGSTGYGTGVVAGQHAGVYVFGVSLDWAWAMPEFANVVLSSVEARYDQSVVLAAQALANGEFHGGVHHGTLASAEITLSPIRDLSNPVSVELNDELAERSNSAVVDSCEPVPHINGFLIPTAVDGYDWPANAQLTIRIFATPGGVLLFTRQAMTDQAGKLLTDVGVSLAPGMAVEVTDGVVTKSVTLVPLTVTIIDPVGDTVSGTGPSGAKIDVIVSDGGPGTGASVIAGNDGHWQVSFARKFDISSKTIVSVDAVGTDKGGTVVKLEPNVSR